MDLNRKFDTFQQTIDQKIERIHVDYDHLSRKIDLYSSSNFGHNYDGDKLATFSPTKFQENLKERGAMVNPNILNESHNYVQCEEEAISNERRREFTTIASTGID